MAKPAPKITLSPSRDIPFDQLVLSQANVRRVKSGSSIEELAEDIARRTLLQSLNVRPLLGVDGEETGKSDVPAGGRRYRALERLVKQKRLAKDAPIPCVVRAADNDILAEDDSLAENAMREQLHPLDQYRAMLSMVEKGEDVEAIAAHFFTTSAVVRQRLKLASVSPKLHDIYAEEGMSLDLLMAFTISDDHARQEQVWDLLAESFALTPRTIRQKLTEENVRAADKRVRFVGIDAYVAAGGGVVRDLFEADGGGWLTDPALLDTMVDDKLKLEANRLRAEGWKWVDTAIDLSWNATHGLRRIAGEEIAMSAAEEQEVEALEEEADRLSHEWSEAADVPDEVHARLDEIDAAIGALADRPMIFDSAELALAGAFLSIDPRGLVEIERGFVRPEDEPVEGTAEDADETGGDGHSAEGAAEAGRVGDAAATSDNFAAEPGEDGVPEEELKPLSDRAVSDLTAWRTLALQDSIARHSATAYLAVLHALVLAAFYGYSRETCIQLALQPVGVSNAPAGLRDTAPGQRVAERMDMWRARLPKSDKDLWVALLDLDADEQAALFAHCASLGVNAQAEIVPKYDNGRISKHVVERRISHSHVLARAVGRGIVEAGWRPTADGYVGSVTKPRILADVAEARGPQFAEMIDHLKKPDMAREAERLLEDSGWLPEPMRTPVLGECDADGREEEVRSALPAFLMGHDEGDDSELPIAAE